MSLTTSAHVYSDYVTSGNGKRAYELLSTRCRRRLSSARFEHLAGRAAAPGGGPLPIKTISTRVQGRRALVSYTYPGGLNRPVSDLWVKEDGVWREDSCWPRHGGAQRSGELTNRQLKAATYWAQYAIGNTGPDAHNWSATADLHPGFIRHSNTHHECTSGTLLRVVVISSLPPTNGHTVVTTNVLEADPQALHLCEAFVRTGNDRPPPGATVLLPLPGVKPMYRHIGHGPHDLPPGNP